MSNQKIVTETALSALASDIKTALSGKANSNDVYPKSQTYNRTEIDNALDLKADKSELYNVYPTDQESGAIAHFTDGADNIPVKSLVSQIVAVQSSGTPSPSNPLPIQTFTQANVTLAEKYIRATPTTPQTYSQNGIDVTTYANGRIEINGTATSSVAINIDIIGFTAFDDNTRKINFNNDFASSNAYVYFRNGSTNVDSWSMTSLYRTYTNYGTLANKYVDRIAIVIASGTTISNGSMMIEFIVMDTATTHTINFGQTVYGGHFDNKGNLVVTHGYKNDFSGRAWAYNSARNYFTCDVSLDGLKPVSSYTTQAVNCICSTYQVKNRNELADLCITFDGSSSTVTQLQVRDNSFSGDVDAFKSSLSNFALCYELATPITLSITSQDIPTLLGENNIFSNTGDVEVDYHADIGLYIDKKISSLAQA